MGSHRVDAGEKLTPLRRLRIDPSGGGGGVRGSVTLDRSLPPSQGEGSRLRWNAGPSFDEITSFRGVSIKELERRTGLARNTIRTALRASEPPAFQTPRRPSKLDPFKEEVRELLRTDPKLPGVRVGELIAPLGYEGGKTIVDDCLREVRPLFVPARTFRRTIYRPGARDPHRSCDRRRRQMLRAERPRSALGGGKAPDRVERAQPVRACSLLWLPRPGVTTTTFRPRCPRVRTVDRPVGAGRRREAPASFLGNPLVDPHTSGGCAPGMPGSTSLGASVREYTAAEPTPECGGVPWRTDNPDCPRLRRVLGLTIAGPDLRQRPHR